MPDKRKLYLVASVAMVVIMIVIIVVTVLNGNKQNQVANQNNRGANVISGTGSNTDNNTDSSSSRSTSSRSGSSSSSSGTSSSSRSSGGDDTKPEDYPIKRIDQVAQNLPKEEILNIQRQIGYTLKINRVSGNHGDIIIRKNSYRQTMTDTDRLIYQTDFIIDLPKIKQSYQVKDTYSPLPAEKSGLYDYTTLILCLDKSQLIYGDFNCNDRIKSEQRGY